MYRDVMSFTNAAVTGFWRDELNKTPDHFMNRHDSDKTLTWSQPLFFALRRVLEDEISDTDWYASRLHDFRVEGRKIVAIYQVNDA